MKLIKNRNFYWKQYYRVWIRKYKCILNLIYHQPDVKKIDLHAKDPFEAKYQLFINKRKSVSWKPHDICEAFIEYSNGYDNIYEIINEYSSNKNQKSI